MIYKIERSRKDDVRYGVSVIMSAVYEKEIPAKLIDWHVNGGTNAFKRLEWYNIDKRIIECFKDGKIMPEDYDQRFITEVCHLYIHEDRAYVEAIIRKKTWWEKLMKKKNNGYTGKFFYEN